MELISPQFVNLIAVIAILVGLALAAWWIIAMTWLHSRNTESGLPHIDLPANLQEVLTGIPPALLIFYGFTVVAMIAYVLYIWLGGISY